MTKLPKSLEEMRDECVQPEAFEAGVFAVLEPADKLAEALRELKAWGYRTQFEHIDKALADWQAFKGEG